MSHPTDLRYTGGQPYNRSEPMPTGEPIRRGDTVTNVDPLGNAIPEAGGYTVAPGLARQAELEARGPQPAISDAIAEDAVPPEYPAGCPRFRPLTHLGFAEKAEAFDLYDLITELGKSVGSPKKGDELDAKRAAGYYRILAQIDTFLSFVAVDKDEYLAWEGRHDDTMFGLAWTAYQAGAQPGEAASSSS
jgi:hypothetical protein